MSSLLIVVSAQQCRTTYSTKVRYLKGHVISAHNVKDHGHCLILCSEDQRCQSTNFQLRNLVCELNDADRHTHPWDYEFKDGYTYSDYVAQVSVRSNVCMFTLTIWLFNPAGHPDQNFSQSRNPDGFYPLLPIPSIRFKKCLTEVPDSFIFGEPVKGGGIRKVVLSKQASHRLEENVGNLCCQNERIFHFL